MAISFQGAHFPKEVILMGVRWYVAYPLSTRHIEEVMEEPHSIEFSGGVGHCSSKASRGEDLQVEEPVTCRDFSSFHFHPTLPGMLGATLVGHQVVQMGQPA